MMLKFSKFYFITLVACISFAFAEWHEIAGGTGKVQVEILEQSASATTLKSGLTAEGNRGISKSGGICEK
ncbi:hypothetical protein CH330_00825 [candidate division WOR-3 bacterium JGI_Cruoil_03_51_56]|uniref:Uncharacterized protein n=1 Tax=candidate division WOR-3 bacterium JGI_Cruoil_03_51_56 TaxID=1973747 RepID=A0A235BY67_UNCW3|nr:MAG: hypothetical protein CH330_00825 [candidate division WOR-3 bacterium JGI_Cruoil_03_51_56]